MPEKEPPVAREVAASDCAIDDDDGDDTYVEAQRTLCESKQKRPNTGHLRVQEIVPFHFIPLAQSLTSSSVESCVVLENAAFPNPDHRATREKVSSASRRLPSVVIFHPSCHIPMLFQPTAGFALRSIHILSHCSLHWRNCCVGYWAHRQRLLPNATMVREQCPNLHVAV